MRARFAPVVVVLVLVSGGCSGGDPGRPPPASDSSLVSSTSGTSGTSGSSSSSGTATPGGGDTTSGSAADARLAKARTANGRLTTSLYSLVQSLKKLQADNSLATARRALGTATTAARKAVKRQRSAAYPSSTRSCSTVRAAAAEVDAAAAQGAKARTSISAQISALEDDLTSLGTVTKAVVTNRDALAASLKGLPGAPATVPTAEVGAALKEASDRRTEIETAITSVTTVSTEAGRTFDKVTAQRRTISTDACP